MQSRGLSFLLALLFALPLAAPRAWSAPKYKVLHSFTDGNDGGALYGSLLLDGQGNLYGTTEYGGPYGGGTVFELTPNADGTWTETVVHGFCVETGCADGAHSWAGLIFDAAGNLYGTTNSGGDYERGTVFELAPQSDGTWTETVLHSFSDQDGVITPFAGVIMDPSGNFFGTAGDPYELSLGSSGWTVSVLHNFTCRNGDGCGADTGLIRDVSSSLYGTTQLGGTSKNCDAGCGTAYRLQPMPDGSWKETILHSFGTFKRDGAFPGPGAMIMDGKGNLYDTTGGYPHGTVYELTRDRRDHWKETILHTFNPGAGGNDPGAGVVMGKSGELYGTTLNGGTGCDCGVVYKLVPGPKGKWKYTVLHRFTGYDGANPGANLILDSKGNLYGTTITGGAYGYGVAFELSP